MDERQRKLIKSLRQMGSEDAATWLMEHYPMGSTGWGAAILAISHLSWRRADQVRLARYYLRGIPHADGRAYETFASMMSVPRFLRIVEEYLPEAADRRDFLFYNLVPVLRAAARTDSDREAVSDFLARCGLTA